ncbi:hypothetical protein FOMPIDRAFT_1033883 [Fomitopsis schrenkii]|uniref:Endonuclease/exonuclease/phosphatase domain-containing protein n=1 Tax=Fomitopsis schrenkii TaxID=2126942 RepID=S8F1E9_FOMSC|nr:hypothetical protein FOMPIDRAFT_1033883 [Fomitopsis schrenkii]
MQIYNSAATNARATAAQGVAIVLNRELVDTADVTTKVIVPGRALLVKLHWHLDRHLTILNVYAPNQPTENAAFWETLRENRARGRLPKPDILAGDFNIVEEPIDRLPAREDPQSATQALADLLRSLGLLDGWRHTEPNGRDYTFPHCASVNKSRLDRIYVTESLLSQSQSWDIHTTGVQTDHRLAVARLSAAHMPHIGKGRWAMPTQLLTDEPFLKQVADAGFKVLSQYKTTRESRPRRESEGLAFTDGTERQENLQSIQVAHANLKKTIQQLARARLKKRIPILKTQIGRLQTHLDTIRESNTPSAMPKRSNSGSLTLSGNDTVTRGWPHPHTIR